jgi:hypothetical protein
MFLMPGLVSPELPAGFAVPTAYDDLTAVILALLALASLRYEAAFAVPMLWLFNLVGLLDLIYANIATFKHHVDPVQLGVSYYLAVINVPAMVVVHILIFAYLLRSLPRLLRSPKSLASDEPDANEPLLFGGLSARWRLRIADFSGGDLEVPLVQRRLRNIFPRLVGMFASGFGLNVLGIIRARAEVLYPATLMVRSYFLVCLVVLYRIVA